MQVSSQFYQQRIRIIPKQSILPLQQQILKIPLNRKPQIQWQLRLSNKNINLKNLQPNLLILPIERWQHRRHTPHNVRVPLNTQKNHNHTKILLPNSPSTNIPVPHGRERRKSPINTRSVLVTGSVVRQTLKTDPPVETVQGTRPPSIKLYVHISAARSTSSLVPMACHRHPTKYCSSVLSFKRIFVNGTHVKKLKDGRCEVSWWLWEVVWAYFLGSH